MSKRDDAYREFLEILEKADVPMSPKLAHALFEKTWNNALAEPARSSEEQMAIARAYVLKAAAALDPGQGLDVSVEMQKLDLDPKAYRSDSRRLRHTLKESELIEYHPAKAAQYIRRITNGS